MNAIQAYFSSIFDVALGPTWALVHNIFMLVFRKKKRKKCVIVHTGIPVAEEKWRDAESIFDIKNTPTSLTSMWSLLSGKNIDDELS